MDTALLLLRIVVGLYIAAHGAQKLFGWLGGPGFTGTQGFLGSMLFGSVLGFRGLLWRRAECQVQLLSRTARDFWDPGVLS